MVDLAKRPFAALSGGQRQRALVAQALVSDPPLLLMDEPTASVDAPMEHKLYELFGRLNKERTIVFVSHNLKVVTSHVTHVLCVNREAEMHAIGDITSSVFQAAYGGDLTVLRHDETCHVIDSSDVLHSPHTAEADRSTPSP
jgi:zinc transport system ATP-binding protein